VPTAGYFFSSSCPPFTQLTPLPRELTFLIEMEPIFRTRPDDFVDHGVTSFAPLEICLSLPLKLLIALSPLFKVFFRHGDIRLLLFACLSLMGLTVLQLLYLDFKIRVRLKLFRRVYVANSLSVNVSSTLALPFLSYPT